MSAPTEPALGSLSLIHAAVPWSFIGFRCHSYHVHKRTKDGLALEFELEEQVAYELSVYQQPCDEQIACWASLLMQGLCNV